MNSIFFIGMNSTFSSSSDSMTTGSLRFLDAHVDSVAPFVARMLFDVQV